MPGEFLPPVVTYLDGNIDGLIDKVNEARALIKSLGNQKVTIKFDVDQASMARATAGMTLLSKAIQGVSTANTDLNRRGGGGGVGWLGWFQGLNPTALHAAALGIAAIGAAVAGAAVAAGSLAAVWANGAANAYAQISGLTQSTLATIPPGVPDYALAKALGLNNLGPNSPFVKASQQGNQQVLSALGGIVALGNKNGPFGSIVSSEGLGVGAGLDNFIAKMDNLTMKGTGLQKFMQAATGDAYNMGKGFGNVALVLGHMAAHMPGEIEWITTGFRNVTGWANEAFKVPGLSGALGAGIFGTLLLHGTALGTSLGAKGLSAVLPKIGLGAMTGEGTAIGTAAGMSTGALMFNPYVALAAAAIGSSLAMYRYQSPTSAAIKGIGQGLYNTGTGSFFNNIAPAIGLFSNGAAFGGTNNGYLSNTFLGKFAPGVENAITFGMLGKQENAHQQNYNALWNAQQSMVSMGGTVNAVASRFRISTAEAAQLLAQSGAKVGANGSIQGGNGQAIRLVQNWLNGNRIVNGTTGQALANIGVGRVVNDSAWKAAGSINSNWDTFMGALTSGGTQFGNLQSVLANVSPSVARNLAASNGTGLVPTMQGISSAGQPLTDFFRQAQSVGAIGGKSAQNSMAEIAASMMPLVGNSKAAQAALLALANEGGGKFKSMADVMKAAGGSSDAALTNLQNSLETTSAKMAKVPEGMQSAMQKVSDNISAVAAGIVAKFPDAYKAFNNLTNITEKFGTNSTQAASAAQKLASQLESHGMTPPEVLAYFQQLGLAVTSIPGYKKIVIDASGQISGNSAVVQAALKSGTYFGGQLTKAYAKGTPAAPPGWAWTGELGPELIHFTGGERVIPANVSRGYASGVGVVSGTPAIHLTVELDGKQIQSSVKSVTFQKNINNGNRDRQGRVAGTFRPRG